MKNIQIADINSLGIKAQAKKDGITDAVIIGTNGKYGDQKITVYQLGAIKVADTNGDPVWEDSCPATWAEMMKTLVRGLAVPA